MIDSNWPPLPAKAREAVRRLNFSHPTPVQLECLPAALAGKSLLAVAPTGTGKTLVYLLPIWNAHPKPGHNLVVVPTRELGYQVSQMVQAMGPDVRDGLALCVGGHEVSLQLKTLKRPWHTLIATPGRLIDLMDRLPNLLQSIRLLVLDEFDRLIDLGFEEQLSAILAKLSARKQTLLFSATGAEEALERLPIGKVERHVLRSDKSPKLSEEFYFLKTNRKKNELLLNALASVRDQVIVFVGNREKANHLNGFLRLRGLSSQALHGDRLQKERAKVYQDFHSGRFKVLVATDLAGRGLDIPEVDLIINFDLPRTFRDYVHRLGRTARRSRPGACISFVGPDEYLTLRNLEKAYGSPLPCHPQYQQRDAWFALAKRNHEANTRLEKRREFIRKEQGLSPKPS